MIEVIIRWYQSNSLQKEGELPRENSEREKDKEIGGKKERNIYRERVLR